MEENGVEEVGWGGVEERGGGCSRIKDKIEGTKCVEHNTSIGNNDMNEDCIEDV